MTNLKAIAVSILFATFSSNLNANLLVNAGFEAGLNNWMSSGGADIRTSDPTAYEGLNYVYGRSTSLFTIWQDVDLLGNGYSTSDIDSGMLTLQFGGWQSGWDTQKDNGQITIKLFDSAMSEIGSTNLDSFFSNKVWEEQSGTTELVSGARYVRYQFVGVRESGSNNDAYLDAAYLNVAAVPIPSAVWLFGSALVSFAGLRKRTGKTKFL